jgi:hypothetical protein
MGKEKNEKLLMISAASEALKYKNQNPSANSEKIIGHVLSSLNSKVDSQISAIAAVNEVLKMKEKNSYYTDKQILQELMNNTEKILMQVH